jgi:hypothetical protein
MKTLLLALTLGFFVSASATTLSLESLQIELVSGWVHSMYPVGCIASKRSGRLAPSWEIRSVFAIQMALGCYTYRHIPHLLSSVTPYSGE